MKISTIPCLKNCFFSEEPYLQKKLQVITSVALTVIGFVIAISFEKALMAIVIAGAIGIILSRIFYKTLFNSDVQIDNANSQKEKTGDFISSLQQGAEQGDLIDQVNLGTCYVLGDRVSKDYEKALFWWKKAAKAGNGPAQYYLCVFFHNPPEIYAPDRRKALYWLKKAAKSGFAKAQYKLAHNFYKSIDYSPNYQKAFYWWEKAAIAGNLSAQSKLGYCYFRGEGTEQDYTKAAFWWEKAAEAGHKRSQNFIGSCYFQGVGVVKNVDMAKFWWEKSAKQGNEDAQINLNRYIDVNA